MKKIFTLIAVSLGLFSFSLSAGIDDVVSAFKAGNAAQAAKFFDNTVDIALPAKTSSYSKSQAEVILRDCFNTNQVRSFTILHQGNRGGSEYCIGTLVTKNGTFRTTIFMKQRGDRQYLQEIRFES